MDSWIFPFVFPLLRFLDCGSGRDEEPSGGKALRLIQIRLATPSFEQISAARQVQIVASANRRFEFLSNDEAPAFAKATAWQANDEHARAGAARVGGNAARVAGTSPGEVSGQWLGCKLP